MTTRNSLLAVTMVAAATVAGSACSSSKHAAPTCRPAHAPEYPTTDASLTDGDAGRTWCVKVGQTLTVTLHVPLAQSASRWAPVTPSDSAVLEPVSNGVVSLPRGVTATFFAAHKPGVATITSSRSDGATWKATVVSSP